MEEKKKFEKPEIQGIEFEQDVQLLAGSQLDDQLDGQLDDPDDYLDGGDPFNNSNARKKVLWDEE